MQRRAAMCVFSIPTSASSLSHAEADSLISGYLSLLFIACLSTLSNQELATRVMTPLIRVTFLTEPFGIDLHSV
jgi:hypothetical protein